MESSLLAVSARLEIFVITYNRAPLLSQTLRTLGASPFRGCQVTVLDNCSTDGTPEAVGTAASSLPRLRHIRHHRNIGPCGNILRALELADSTYCWVLCDDDDLFLAETGDVIDELLSGIPDFVSLNWQGAELPAGWSGTGRELMETHRCAFLWHLFLPRLIFRTARLSADVLRDGYEQSHNWFPHFPILISMVRQPSKVYVSRKIVLGRGKHFGYSPIRATRGTIQAFRQAGATRREKRYLARAYRGMKFIEGMAFAALVDARMQPGGFRRRFFGLISDLTRLSLRCGILASSVLPFVLSPGFVHRWAFEKYRRWASGRPGSIQHFDSSR